MEPRYRLHHMKGTRELCGFYCLTVQLSTHRGGLMGVHYWQQQIEVMSRLYNCCWTRGRISMHREHLSGSGAHCMQHHMEVTRGSCSYCWKMAQISMHRRNASTRILHCMWHHIKVTKRSYYCCWTREQISMY